MGRGLDLIAAGLALVVPSLVTPLDPTVPLSVAMVAMLLVVLVRLGNPGVPVAGRLLTSRPEHAMSGVLILAGRITDPEHHPLRPRAPGTA